MNGLPHEDYVINDRLMNEEVECTLKIVSVALRCLGGNVVSTVVLGSGSFKQ